MASDQKNFHHLFLQVPFCCVMDDSQIDVIYSSYHMLTVDQLGEIRFNLFMQLMFNVDQFRNTIYAIFGDFQWKILIDMSGSSLSKGNFIIFTY